MDVGFDLHCLWQNWNFCTNKILMLKPELDEALEEDFVVDGLVADDPQVGHHLAHVALDENWLLEAKKTTSHSMIYTWTVFE